MGYDRCRHESEAGQDVWVDHPRIRVHPIACSPRNDLGGGVEAAALVRVLPAVPERPADLPLLRDLGPDVLPLEEPVRPL